jgi:hypothetical protein
LRLNVSSQILQGTHSPDSIRSLSFMTTIVPRPQNKFHAVNRAEFQTDPLPACDQGFQPVSLCASLANRANSAKASGADSRASALISQLTLLSEPFGRPPSFPFSRQISVLDIFSSHFAPWFILVFFQ